MADMSPLGTCIFPVAGLGTRFLPVTKNIPKEMLPLIDRPIIQYGVEEAVSSGCSSVVFVTGVGKESIREYFSTGLEVEEILKKQGRFEIAESLKKIRDMADFRYAMQDFPKGLGHAVLCAREECGSASSVGLILPDDVMIGGVPALKQLDDVRLRLGGSALAVEKVSPSDTHRYGIVDAVETEPGIYRVRGLVEKPEPGKAPSNLAVFGRYVLSSGIFKHLETIEPGAGGEYQLTDALSSMLREEPIWAVECDTARLDCGTIPGWIEATTVMALARDDLRESVARVCRDYL